MWQDTSVLVTGGAGFLGSNLVDALLAEGAVVTAIDNFVTGRRQNIAHLAQQSRFTLIEANLNDSLDTYWPAGFQPEVVFHLASPASPPHYQAEPVLTYLVNSWATHQLLEKLRQTSPSARLVFASTSEVYGDPEQHPQRESYWGNVNPNGLRSCYDEAKRLGETVCGVFQREYGLDARIVRIFNTYGPRIDPEDGRVIPNFIKQTLEGQKLTIYGEGQQTRSYCFVSDLIRGFLAMAEKDGLAGETINLGNPAEYTVRETAELIFKQITGQDLTSANIDFRPLPADDPTRRKPDITKAQELLGWSPQVSLEDGLRQTVEFFKAEA